jgi:hypothetical protein
MIRMSKSRIIFEQVNDYNGSNFQFLTSNLHYLWIK